MSETVQFYSAMGFENPSTVFKNPSMIFVYPLMLFENPSMNSKRHQCTPHTHDSPGVGFWASSELLEFYDTPNMHRAFSFLDKFLAKFSNIFRILRNFCFAPCSAAQLTRKSGQPRTVRL